jgi:hypothetical protein
MLMVAIVRAGLIGIGAINYSNAIGFSFTFTVAVTLFVAVSIT